MDNNSSHQNQQGTRAVHNGQSNVPGSSASSALPHANASAHMPGTHPAGAAAGMSNSLHRPMPSFPQANPHQMAQMQSAAAMRLPPGASQQASLPASSSSNSQVRFNAQPSPSWNVPNPLAMPGSSAQSKAPPPSNMPTHFSQVAHIQQQQQLLQQQQQEQYKQQQLRQQQINQQHQQLLQQQQRMQAAHQQVNSAQQQQQQQQQRQTGPPVIVVQEKGKTKRVLSPEAKDLLAKAVWSAIRDPAGQVAPSLLQQAVKMGLPEDAILKAARVAREREALQRKGPNPSTKPIVQPSSLPVNADPGMMQRQQMMRVQQYQQQQQQMQQQQMMFQQQQQQQQQLQQQQQQQQLLMKKKQEQLKLQQERANRENEAKLVERRNWKRAQSAIFLTQKGRYVSVPYSVGAMVRSSSTKPTLDPSLLKRNSILREASRLQKLARVAFTASSGGIAAESESVDLVEPERFKRIKIEPKKHAKGLDRAARKSRQTLADSFVKQHKEFCKAISSHQQEFFKFHRQRRADLARVTKTLRDSLDKEERKKEKDAVAAEKARMAALKANDMTAYSKLLEETKNERLQYLLENTEKHFTQISSLLQQRSDQQPSSSNKQKSYYATAHYKTEEVRQPSILVGGDLKEYQLAGLQWMVSLYNNKLNGILADEMGLGKTIQAISLLAYLMEFKHNMGPFLVIVPLSTMSNWENEFARWCPAARVVAYKGTPLQRRDIFRDQVRAGQFNVLLTTYEYIIRDKKYLRKTEWQYAVVDEGHRMKNAQSKFAVTLGSQYTTHHRILLTGTPLMNDLSELWSLLNFLLPSIFNSVETFDQWFSRPFSQFGATKENEEGTDALLSNEERVLIIHRLHELLRPFMLRRVKSEVLDQLPEKVEKVLRCELSSWQKVLYQQISEKAFADTGISATARGLNNVVMQLRKVCNHPLLFSPEGYQIGDSLIQSSGKVALLDKMLPKLKAAGHRVLMFTQMTAVMTILEDYFSYRGYLSLRLDGSTPAEEREKRMYKFNAPDSPYFIFLLSTRAGGLGLNLTSADTVIIFDSDWNPMMDLQAQDRAHRIGQRNDVSVFRLITNSPVEEKILSRATEKLNVSELVVESGKFNKDSVDTDNSMERKRLMEVLLTDFDTTNNQNKNQLSEKSGSDDGDEDDDGSEASEKENLNELLSNNESDYQLYESFDREREVVGGALELFVGDETVPDWIRFPNSGPGAKSFDPFASVDIDGSRKRKAVAYDDGLTEKQFLRIMENNAVEEERAKKKAKVARSAARGSLSDNMEEDEPEEVEDGSTLLTDWTYRKLISCAKAVVSLKDASKKRRISEIFLEKPDPATFPDYYELIEKPVAINDILRKCRAKMYSNVTEFRADWKLMFENAVKFNGEGSWVVEDATALEKELDRVLKKNGFTDDQKPPTSKKKQLRIKLSLKDLKPKTSSQP